jgi:GR25 family glycosyltransferase involved in LPS biosynthesis
MNFDYFDETVYINLASRPDRRAKFERRLKEVGITARRYNADVIDPSFLRLDDSQRDSDRNRARKIGCSKSHYNVVKYAKDNRLKNILIFEDDCIFVEGFREKAWTAVSELKELESGEFDKHHRKGAQIQWDMFFFGGEPMNQYVSISDNLSLVAGMYCTHAYAINSCYYDSILEGPSALNIYKDPAIDIFYVHKDPSTRRFIMTTELLAYQEDGLTCMGAEDDPIFTKGIQKQFQNKYNEFK